MSCTNRRARSASMPLRPRSPRRASLAQRRFRPRRDDQIGSRRRTGRSAASCSRSPARRLAGTLLSMDRDSGSKIPLSAMRRRSVDQNRSRDSPDRSRRGTRRSRSWRSQHPWRDSHTTAHWRSRRKYRSSVARPGCPPRSPRRSRKPPRRQRSPPRSLARRGRRRGSTPETPPRS